ncbi:MAG: hypothetical protein Q8N99_03980 [Nanoarchaeota archaeon]|nr:hypothetical protein [Nanoarchaeota archaeon]
MEDKNNMVQDFLLKIKSNKKYKTISDMIVIREIYNYLKKNPKVSDVNKQSIKDIRKILHRLYSSYQIGKKNKKEKLLIELRKNPSDINTINKILSLSISSKERLNHYKEAYETIFKITKSPRSIIDLGCGLNPISYVYMGTKSLDYNCYDIDENDIQFLNDYFGMMKKYGLNGKAKILDIKDIEKISNLPDSDIIFMFKLLDIINTKSKKPGEEIINLLIEKTKFIIVSFSTNTLGGRPMNIPRRKGFEFMLERNNLKYQTFNIPNEIFYIISK